MARSDQPLLWMLDWSSPSDSSTSSTDQIGQRMSCPANQTSSCLGGRAPGCSLRWLDRRWRRSARSVSVHSLYSGAGWQRFSLAVNSLQYFILGRIWVVIIIQFDSKLSISEVCRVLGINSRQRRINTWIQCWIRIG